MSWPQSMAERSSSRLLILRSAFRPPGYARAISPASRLEPAVQQAFVDLGVELHPPGDLAEAEDLGLGRRRRPAAARRRAGGRCTTRHEKTNGRGWTSPDEGVARRELDRLPAQSQIGTRIDVAAGRQDELLRAQAHAQGRHLARQRRRPAARARRRGTGGPSGRRRSAPPPSAISAAKPPSSPAVGQRVAQVEPAHVELEPGLAQVLADQRRRPAGVVLHDDGWLAWLVYDTPQARAVARPATRARRPRAPTDRKPKERP